ncbi:hypothetical protein OAA11_00175 [Schleiferiaceae bacterium]|nr:hypothetical protein [Schleiferiaceae bacterium]
MATWKKIIVSGSDAELNNLNVLKASGSFSGSFQGEVLGTMASSSVATLAQTASVALRANALAPTVTATSASVAARATTLTPAATASFADLASDARTATSASIATTSQTASVAVRANSLAPTVTATSASVAARATTLSAAATASFADLASDARTATSASIATTSQTASVAGRANSLAPTVTATSSSVAARATTLSPAATASFADISTLSRGGSGSFSGSYQGDGSNLTGLATTLTVDGDSGTQDVSLTADDLQILGTTNEIVTAVTKAGNDVKATISLPDDVTIGRDLTITRDVVVSRNLTVQGTASFQATTDLDVADRFIRMASGSNAAGDGGIAVIQSGSKNAEAFAYDSATTRWGITGSFDAATNTIAPDAFMATVVEGAGGALATATIAKYTKKGNMFVSSSGDVYIYS